MNKSVVNPQKFVQYLKSKGYLNNAKVPKVVIFVFLESIIDDCKKRFKLKKIDGFDAGVLYALDDENSNIGIFYCRGIGSPVAVINLEELIAFGVDSFLILGTAGSLQKDIVIGDTILCDKAISEEGTSKHYIQDENQKPLTAHADLFSNYQNFLNGLKYYTKTGTSWTTDAPYRETEEKVLAYQKQGVLTVEMEISALYAVASFYDVKIASAFVISDSLADINWTPGFFSEKVTYSLSKLLDNTIKFAQNIK